MVSRECSTTATTSGRGYYNTVCGIGILLGNAATGWAVDLARAANMPPLPWAAMVTIGALCAAALTYLPRRGLLVPATTDGASAATGELPTVRLPVAGWGSVDDATPTRPLPIIRQPLYRQPLCRRPIGLAHRPLSGSSRDCDDRGEREQNSQDRPQPRPVDRR